jgi:hypothetical protein
MAGPVASLLLRQPLTEYQLEDLEGWLNEIGRITGVENSPDERYSADFVFTNFPPLVTDPANPSCTFLLNLFDPEMNKEFRYEDDKKEILRARLGFVPEQLILVSAMCNQLLDHRLLAHFLIEMAEKFGANLVDMGGEIEDRPDLPGKVIESPSEEHPGFVPIIVDVEFLKNWLNHPRFHMIK